MNNMSIKVCMTLFVIVCSYCHAFAQTTEEIVYKYDTQGNRIERIIELKDSGDESESSTEDSNEDEIQIEISLSPNPTSGILTISILNATDELEFTYSVVSLEAIKCSEGVFKGNGDHTIDISSNNTGVYIVNISYDSTFKSFTILKI